MTIETTIRELYKEIPKDIDYWLTCASFETRCLTLVDIENNLNVKTLVLFNIKQFKVDAKDSIATYKNHFNKIIQEVELDNNNPTSVADAMLQYFEKDIISGKKIVIDISTFTRESMLIIYKYFHLLKQRCESINIVYRTAHVSRFLSDGILAIRSVIGYMGDIDPGKPLHLIVLSGFEQERARNIIDHLEPDYISIGYGSENQSISSELHEINIALTNQLISYYSSDNVEIFEHSLRDPLKTMQVLVDLISQHYKRNFVIAPLNNKISTIGAGLAAIRNQKVQICYAQMSNYNLAYSKPKDECIVFQLN